MAEDLEDFEALLDPSFSAIQFSNDLLKATNGESSSAELDLETSIKKVNYDMREVDMRINDIIKANPTQIMDQMFKAKALKKTTAEGLKPSLEYLDMSYQRLQTDVLEPYERAQKLQNVLSKVHQTSILLRDGLIYIHLANRVQSLLDQQKPLTFDKSWQLVSLHSQLRMSMEENANLTSLRLIKKLETEVVTPNKRDLLNFLSISLTRETSNTNRNEIDKDTIIKLVKSLYILSQQDFVSTIHKIVLTNVAASVQTLTKTLNSIKNFPIAFGDVVKKGEVISLLDSILNQERVENTTLLSEYMSQMRPRPLSPTQLYWSRVAATFKKEFELSYTRGGPVGKSLSKNKDMIINTIKTSMHNGHDNSTHLGTMMKSVAILNIAGP